MGIRPLWEDGGGQDRSTPFRTSTAPAVVPSRTAPSGCDSAPEVDIVVVVVNYRSAALLGPLLGSVPAAAGDLTYRAVVVDNDSGDDVESLEPVMAAHPWATLVQADRNLGYAGGINLGLRSARQARGVCVANPDVQFGPSSLAHLLVAAERYGAAAPRLLDREGSTLRSIRREPSVLGAWGEALLGDHLPGRPPGSPRWSAKRTHTGGAARSTGRPAPSS